MSESILWNAETNQPLKRGDKVAGGRLSHHYAQVDSISDETLGLRYNGEVKTVRFALPMDEHVASRLGIKLKNV